MIVAREPTAARRDGLGVVANIAVLERELGKLAYQRAKLEDGLAANKLTEAEAAQLRGERHRMQERHVQLVKLLDEENSRLKAGRAGLQ